MFIVCERIGGQLQESLETSEAAFLAKTSCPSCRKTAIRSRRSDSCSNICGTLAKKSYSIKAARA